MVGNGVTDRNFDGGSALLPFAHGMGLISDDIYQVSKHYYSFKIRLNLKILQFLETTLNFCRKLNLLAREIMMNLALFALQLLRKLTR